METKEIIFSTDLRYYMVYIDYPDSTYRLEVFKLTNQCLIYSMHSTRSYGHQKCGFIDNKPWCFISKEGSNTLINLENGKIYSNRIILGTSPGYDIWCNIHSNPDTSILAVHGTMLKVPGTETGRYYFFDFSDPEKGWPELVQDKYFDLPIWCDEDLKIIWLDNITCKILEPCNYCPYFEKFEWDLNDPETKKLEELFGNIWDSFEEKIVSEVVLQKVGNKMQIIDSQIFYPAVSYWLTILEKK